MHRLSYLIILLLFLPLSTLPGQSPYQLDWKRDLLITGAGATVTGFGHYFRTNTPILSTIDLAQMNREDVNEFDRIAISNFSDDANLASDVIFYGSNVLPLLFIAGKTSRNDLITIGVIWTETMLLTGGTTILTKYSFRRTRPFVYNNLADPAMKQEKNARASFISGHTSLSAANCFFVAKVFADYFPESPWKNAVWTTASLLPAFTAFLRIRAGKHFPTDVIAGYTVGAAFGILVPHLHKHQRSENISLIVSPNGLYFAYRF